MVIEFDKISSHSPIWVFQSNKILDSSLISQIEVDVNNFLNNWTSHNLEIKSSKFSFESKVKKSLYLSMFLVIFTFEPVLSSKKFL